MRLRVGSSVSSLGVDDGTDGSEAFGALGQAIAELSGGGRSQSLERWFGRELDPDGVPRRMPSGHWLPALVALAEARAAHGRNWPALFDARIEGLFLHTLRFSRPDGSTVFGPLGISAEAVTALRSWADHLSEPGCKTVLNWWFPARRARHAPPPLPATSWSQRPLAVLRADWSTAGDLVAVDHRRPGIDCFFELCGLGRRWLGPTWAGADSPATASSARPVLWQSDSSCDLLEWSFRVGPARYLRTAFLLRGRRLGLLADQVEGSGRQGELRIDIPDGLSVVTSPEDRSLVLTSGPRKPSARLIPLSIPFRATTPERGSFTGDERRVVLEQPLEGKRGWLPLLVSWEPSRARKRLIWRTLTVTEGGHVCAPETAAAFRVAWGRDESLVIYRSLVEPASRTFLGHRTSVRFLVGLFTREGTVEPIVSVEE